MEVLMVIEFKERIVDLTTKLFNSTITYNEEKILHKLYEWHENAENNRREELVQKSENRTITEQEKLELEELLEY